MLSENYKQYCAWEYTNKLYLEKFININKILLMKLTIKVCWYSLEPGFYSDQDLSKKHLNKE